MLDEIKAAVKAVGILCYDSAEKIDVCKKPYVVVYDAGITIQPRTKGMLGAQIYEVVCMVPFEDVSGLAPLVKTVRGLMRSFPQLTLSSVTGTGVEETLKGRATSLTYSMQIRLQ